MASRWGLRPKRSSVPPTWFVRRQLRLGGSRVRLQHPHHAALDVDQIVVGISKERRPFEGTGPLRSWVGGRYELRLYLRRCPERHVVERCDLRNEPWARRRALLVQLLADADAGIRLNDHIEDVDGAVVFRQALRHGTWRASPSGATAATSRGARDLE